MGHISSIATGLVAACAGACISVPAQVVSDSEALHDHAREIGMDYTRTVALYHERIHELNDRLTERALEESERYAHDVRFLVEQLEQLSGAYAAVSAALEGVLAANPAKPRAAFFDRAEAVDLAVALIREKKRAARVDLELDAILASLHAVDPAEGRADIANRHVAVQRANDRSRGALDARIQQERDRLDATFETHLSHVRSLVRPKAERKRLRSRSKWAADRLANDGLKGSWIYEIFEVFDRALGAENGE